MIIKIVNASKKAQSAEVNIEGLKKLDAKARLTLLQNNDLEAINTLDTPSVIAPSETTIETNNKTITLELKGYSFSIIRVKY